MRILIAEDDLTSRTMLTAIVGKWGYEPIAVEDGEAAWQILQSDDPPRLMILDLEMPRLDGLGLCRRIVEADDDDPPYIILLTAHSETDCIVRGLNAGANDYIAKPFSNAELQVRLQVGQRTLDKQEESSQAMQILSIQATHDVLTGLMNRRGILGKLEKKLARNQLRTLSIGLCDIDYFKRINDKYGHPAGDAVLQEVAKRIQAALRPYDRVGRYGGEEFLIILDTRTDEVLAPFERIRRAIADKPFLVEQESLVITISFGVAVGTASADIENQLITAADEALYEAKGAGRNRTVIHKLA